ncbi:DUF6503 family protein [Christiangramia forsetii]|uniref:Deoxyribose-phosphate aldolase n=2 Tax=Christiangramia forsetii TaxID=411153 RepID=A0M3N9_CHRFK|nr:DUF6503 family protein [Christiangramia forsetii]GGG25354.1 hypothetical protein GCM10011532_05900 [Christiangramia forsetii]CAL67234.1 conserved hypothetical protein [Christiangramia forsetii KT0803]
MKYISLLLVIFLFASCNEEKKELTADEIVNKAIENAGGEKYKNAEIDFVFRKQKYKSKRAGGKFQFERTITDSSGNQVYDILNNEGLERFVNDSAVKLQDSLVVPVGNSINSVHYFVQLPFGLNAESANKELIGKDSIAGREYYEIMVKFAEEGGGTDHEDEYLYWIDTQNFEVDYLAYNFEINDGGIRFRKAFNHRIIEGIRFVDYENYKYTDLSTPLEKLDSLYENRELELLSVIETKDIAVKLNQEN